MTTHEVDAPAVLLAEFLRRAASGDKLLASRAELWSVLESGQGCRIATLNVYDLFHLTRSEQIRELILAADYWTADGAPVVDALAQLGVPVDRVTGSDLCLDLLRPDVLTGVRRVAVLGDTDASIAKFGAALRQAGRELVFADTGRRDEWTQASIGAALVAARPDVVLVAVGTPFHFAVVSRVAAFVGCPVIGIGAGVAFAAGEQRRAPRFVQKVKLEAAWRLLCEPRRLFRRYVLECYPLMRHLRAATEQVAAERATKPVAASR